MDNTLRRFEVLGVLALLALTMTVFVPTTAASASTARVASAHDQASGFLQVVHSQNSITPTSSPMPASPNGCNSGYFCSYNQGNGGDLCFQTNGNEPYWPSGCANENDSAFDNSSHGVYLYWGSDYSGAYYLLCANCYLLYMTQNDFNQCPGGGTSCSGYGQAMYDNVASSKFV